MKDILQAAVNLAKVLRYRFWIAPRGFGQSRSLQEWENQYRTGAWDYLYSVEELDHYSVIIGYLRHFFDRAEILDLGCGHGRLLDLLPPGGFQCYTGVDISTEAISRASQLNVDGARFVAADFETWTAHLAADVILFNESLYYGRRPTEIVKRFLPCLKPGGKVIISMFEDARSLVIWRHLDSILRPVHGVRLQADCGRSWIVRIFDPAPGASAADDA